MPEKNDPFTVQSCLPDDLLPVLQQLIMPVTIIVSNRSKLSIMEWKAGFQSDRPIFLTECNETQPHLLRLEFLALIGWN